MSRARYTRVVTTNNAVLITRQWRNEVHVCVCVCVPDCLTRIDHGAWERRHWRACLNRHTWQSPRVTARDVVRDARNTRSSRQYTAPSAVKACKPAHPSAGVLSRADNSIMGQSVVQSGAVLPPKTPHKSQNIYYIHRSLYS